MRKGLLLDHASGGVKPRGTRPPRPGAIRTVLRLALIISVVLSVVPPVTAWMLGGRIPESDTPSDMILLVGDTLAAWEVTAWVRGCALLLSGVLMGEVALQLWVRWRHRCAILAAAGSAAQRQMYRVRVPRQTTNQAGMRASDPSGDLFRALAAAIPARGQRWGRAPYVALTLLGEPDQATALQYVVAGGTAAQRDQVAALLYATVTGQQLHARVELIDDPVEAVICTPGQRWVAWHTYHLELPPYYPIRLPEDTDQTDLLSVVVQALRPGKGEHMLELQIVIQPIRGVWASFLHRGWRGHATALRLRLQDKQDYALSDDVRALETKLAGVPFYATVRAVVVVDDQHTACTALERITQALGNYEARTSHVTQRWVADAMHCVEIES